MDDVLLFRKVPPLLNFVELRGECQELDLSLRLRYGLELFTDRCTMMT